MNAGDGSRFVVHESDQMTVWCEPGRALIEHKIHRYCHSEPFRVALTAGADAMKQHGCHAWLSDDRLNGPLTPEDAEWAKAFWFPRAKAAGWTHWAIVKPEAVVAQLNVQQFIDLYRKQGVEVGIFSELAPAGAWLKAHQAA